MHEWMHEWDTKKKKRREGTCTSKFSELPPLRQNALDSKGKPSGSGFILDMMQPMGIGLFMYPFLALG